MDRRRDRDVVVSASVFLVMLGLVVVGWGPLLAVDEAVIGRFNRAVSDSELVISALHALTKPRRCG